jgi:hypothetical protein
MDREVRPRPTQLQWRHVAPGVRRKPKQLLEPDGTLGELSQQDASAQSNKLENNVNIGHG